MRKPIIAANWKMHKTRDEALKFIYAVVDRVPSTIDNVVCAPSYVLRCLVKRQKENIKIGAQNMHFEEKGAFTGEISASMLNSVGVTYVIVGHSERRAMFNETDQTVNLKLKTAFSHNLLPILCVGESLEDREAGNTNNIISTQLEIALNELDSNNIKNLVIAYEPIWAIGTGKTATADMAEETCAFIRDKVALLFDKETADEMRIQYGGSVKVDNIAELMSKPNIDGALIGGASLDSEDFVKMTKLTEENFK
ncbi:MAG: triose-phosphate isomerase [Bacilli bacterium]